MVREIQKVKKKGGAFGFGLVVGFSEEREEK
jgi:hypothetical protein